jgi:hypothetical protein
MRDQHDRPIIRDESPAKYQVGGDHYLKDIQPWDIWRAYALDPWEANAVKYILRRKPGVSRVQDLMKARHYIEQCIIHAQADVDDCK